MNRHDQAEAAEVLRRVLAAVDSGELDAPARVVHALTGAALALETQDDKPGSPKPFARIHLDDLSAPITATVHLR